MKINNGYELERKLYLPSIEEFKKLVLWDGKEFGGWRASFSFNRNTIFMDTKEYDLAKRDITFTFIPNAGYNKHEHRLVLKLPMCKLSGKEEIVARSENIVELLKNSELLFAKLSSHINVEITSLIPSMIINQTRHKRGLIMDGRKYYISIDKVTFINPSDHIPMDQRYIFEIELQNRWSQNEIENLNKVVEFVISKFNASPAEYGKYHYGLSLMQKTTWNTSHVFQNNKEWLDAVNIVKSISDENKDQVYETIKKIKLYSQLKYFSNQESKEAKQMLIISNSLMNRFNKDHHSGEEDYGRRLFYEIYEKDIQFETIKDSKGKIYQLTRNTYSTYLASQDRVLRSNAFESLYRAYRRYQHALAACLDIHYHNRKSSVPFEGVFPSSHKGIEYSNLLMQITEENICYLHDYMRIRRKLLNLDDYCMYDIQHPIINNSKAFIPYSIARNFIKYSLKNLGIEYIKVLDDIFDGGYIDLFPRKGKKSGSYAIATLANKFPYISTQFKPEIYGTLALAHELGHAIAGIYAPIDYSRLPVFLAEVHAGVHEALLMRHMIEVRVPGIDEYRLEKYRANFFRQIMLAEFEMLMTEHCVAGQHLNVSWLSEKYRSLLSKYYGNAVDLNNGCELEWAKIPYFYRPNYLINYSASFVVSEYLAENIANDKLFAKKYVEFLSDYNRDVEAMFASLGIDLFNLELYNRFFSDFKLTYHKVYDGM
ncbi:hypothetical protein [Alicyclobacillus fructus]|uniref:hypothetical protein n=1 Tax=Alicyclobacillus fructus TaxID=2816082 RepID=UPI001A8C57EC|nr:hypothetical protein [Alicyclobacillus fructus]